MLYSSPYSQSATTTGTIPWAKVAESQPHRSVIIFKSSRVPHDGCASTERFCRSPVVSPFQCHLSRSTPLPLEFAHTDPTLSSAYDIYLLAARQSKSGASTKFPARLPTDTLINIRILGYMLTRHSDSDGVIVAATGRAITSSSSVDDMEGNSVDITAR